MGQLNETDYRSSSLDHDNMVLSDLHKPKHNIKVINFKDEENTSTDNGG